MGTVRSQIDRKLKESFAPSFLEVENESHNHNVPENSETHFKVTLVSEQFAGLLPVKRHQAVYSVLADELAGPVHALALHLYTPEQWDKVAPAPASPDCMGGSKK